MKNNFLLLLTGIILLISQSCIKDTVVIPPAVAHAYDKGVFITSEGMFPTGAGSISFYNRTTGAVQKDIFKDVNGVPLGNIVQSLEIFDTLAYIVVNNSGKVEVVSAGTFKSKGTINGFHSPRYFLGITGSKAYVTDWPDRIAVVDPVTRLITDTIPTGAGPEQMVKTGNDIYVINGGGWGVDSTVTVINTTTDKVTHTIQVAKRPTGIVTDGNGSVWVMCSGKGFNGWAVAGDSEGHLMRINSSTYTVEKDITFPGTDLHPEHLIANSSKTKLYFLYSGGIYQLNIEGHVFGYSVLVETGNFYNLGFDPVENVIFATDALDFQQNGLTYRFNSESGAEINSFGVGVGPGNFYFK
jgi:YVTN family beta-propeller protein